ncbi:MAG: 1,2-phenylacetyl-CoA epoxidase subunit PaaC [Flavisolibacter sp.]
MFPYALHLADNALILAQRNSEWTGHGPVLEQDIAITNIALDLLGQARNFYQYAAGKYNEMNATDKKDVERLVPQPWKKYNRELQEDDLAFLRTEPQYLNNLICELPKGDWAFSILRQFFFSSFQFYQYAALQNSTEAPLAGIAEKSIKEVSYHLRWSSEWVIRLADGTAESKGRIESALSELWPFTGELFKSSEFEAMAVKEGAGVDPASLKEDWLNKIQSVFSEAGLEIPVATWIQSGGKQGRHTEHLGYVLSEMQYLQRTYPDLSW